MQDLTPVGLTKDGRQLILISSAGEEFAVPVDTRLVPHCVARTYNSASWR